MIKKVILLGGSQVLLNLSKVIIAKGLDLLIVSEELHLEEKVNAGGTLRENLDKEGFKYIECDKMSRHFLEAYTDSGTVGISICAVWIITQEVIDLLEGRLYNIHGARLPKHRGGGGYSWKILAQDNLGGFAIHKLEAGIDTGDILLFKEFTFPLSCRIPQDYYDYAQGVEDELLIQFLETLMHDEKSLVPIKQMECFSMYWPRLNTLRNGFIDWQWKVEDLELFINAFDDPYPGASTFLNGGKMHLKKCFISKGEGTFHPFQTGIIFRKYDDNLFIASNGGTLVVGNITDNDGNNIYKKIRVGDRFHTPASHLENARSARVSYNSKGLKE